MVQRFSNLKSSIRWQKITLLYSVVVTILPPEYHFKGLSTDVRLCPPLIKYAQRSGAQIKLKLKEQKKNAQGGWLNAGCMKQNFITIGVKFGDEPPAIRPSYLPKTYVDTSVVGMTRPRISSREQAPSIKLVEDKLAVRWQLADGLSLCLVQKLKREQIKHFRREINALKVKLESACTGVIFAKRIHH